MWRIERRLYLDHVLPGELLEIRPAEIARDLKRRSEGRAAIDRVTLDDLALPPRIEQVGEALGRILWLDQIGVVADGAEHGEHGCVHAVHIDLLGRQVPGYVLWHVGRKQAVALPMDEMCCVSAADDIDLMEPDFLFFTDALEHSLRAGSLHAHGNAGEPGFERLAEVL